MIFVLLISATITVQRGTRRRQTLIETLRNSERALGDNQQLLQAVIQNSTAVIYVKELNGSLCSCESQVRRIISRDTGRDR